MTPKEFQKMRQESGLDVSQLARYLGLSHNQIKNIERGTRIPTIQDLSTLYKLHETACPTSHNDVKETGAVLIEDDGGVYFDSTKDTKRGTGQQRGASFGFSILRGGADGMERDSGY